MSNIPSQKKLLKFLNSQAIRKKDKQAIINILRNPEKGILLQYLFTIKI
jgi:hypothetical protein